jgi:hypothetical protein
MKRKVFRRRGRRILMPDNEQVRVEMETFLRALATYPERFAADPRLSFNDYRLSLMAASAAAQAESVPARARAKASGA